MTHEKFEERPELLADLTPLEREVLGAVSSKLLGSYNLRGQISWLRRPRTELDGHTPVEYWVIDPEKVIELSQIG